MQMKRTLKNAIIILLISIFIFTFTNRVYGAENTQINIDIGSSAGILIDSRTGEILYEKDAYTKYYPASTTKIMTALIVLENVSNLKEVATVSYNAVFSIPSGYSTDLLKVGEELTIEDLLYALLVPSCNEAAVVLAEYVSGNVESFATMMNTRAVELGCKNTHFVNPNGVHNEDHYSTAYDLALIAKEAMKNETFRKIVSTASYTLPSTNKYDRIDRNLITTNNIIKKSSKYYYENAIGIKTGTTTPAKNCLVAAATKNGIELIAVVLHADKVNSNNQSIRETDVKNLFEYVFENFSDKTVIAKNGTVQTIKVNGATKDTQNLNLVAENEIKALVTNDRVKQNENAEIILNEKIKAPIKQGEVLGVAKYNINGIEYETNLLAENDVEKSYTFLIIIALIILAFLYLYYNKNKKNKSKNKKRIMKKKKRTKYNTSGYYR